MSDPAPMIPPCCPYCNRDLELRVETRQGGYVHVNAVCPKHGSLDLDKVRALLKRRGQPQVGWRGKI